MDSENFNNHHGTSTAFLTNFTKTVKLTKTLIACHYWRWNSFSCDYFNKSWKLLESGFPDRYFGRSMWDRKPYCELSSHSLHHACACTCNGIHEISKHGVIRIRTYGMCQNSDIYIFFFFFPRVSPMSFLKLRETRATRVFYTGADHCIHDVMRSLHEANTNMSRIWSHWTKSQWNMVSEDDNARSTTRHTNGYFRSFPHIICISFLRYMLLVAYRGVA